MAHSKKFVTGCAAILVALLAVACAGQPSQDQTTTPTDQTSQGQQAAPADPAAPAQGTAPADGTAPAPAETPHN
jgi:hypothetical protein